MRDKVKDEIVRLIFNVVRDLVDEDYIDEKMVARMQRWNYIGVCEEVRKIVREERLIFPSACLSSCRLDKLEALTHANDYEYITETKLVKKNKKGLNENR